MDEVWQQHQLQQQQLINQRFVEMEELTRDFLADQVDHIHAPGIPDHWHDQWNQSLHPQPLRSSIHHLPQETQILSAVEEKLNETFEACRLAGISSNIKSYAVCSLYKAIH